MAAGAFQLVPLFVVAHGAAAVRAFVGIGFDKGVCFMEFIRGHVFHVGGRAFGGIGFRVDFRCVRVVGAVDGQVQLGMVCPAFRVGADMQLLCRVDGGPGNAFVQFLPFLSALPGADHAVGNRVHLRIAAAVSQEYCLDPAAFLAAEVFSPSHGCFLLCGWLGVLGVCRSILRGDAQDILDGGFRVLEEADGGAVVVGFGVGHGGDSVFPDLVDLGARVGQEHRGMGGDDQLGVCLHQAVDIPQQADDSRG